MKNDVLNIYGQTYKISKHFLEKVAKAALEELEDKNKGIIDFSFISRIEIKKLNKKYRGKDQATDVLSFPFLDEPFSSASWRIPKGREEDKGRIIGQVIICYEVAKRQAEYNKNSFEKEIALLLTHGILHLFGYNHKDYNQRKKMENKERIILSKLGLG